MRFLIDECLHTSLTRTANDAGFEAYHVVHRGWAGVPDHRLLDHVLREELTFVTNNGRDFKKLMSEVGLHPGLVVIRQCVEPHLQQELFRLALGRLTKLPDLINRALEVDADGTVELYELPASLGVAD